MSLRLVPRRVFPHFLHDGENGPRSGRERFLPSPPPPDEGGAARRRRRERKDENNALRGPTFSVVEKVGKDTPGDKAQGHRRCPTLLFPRTPFPRGTKVQRLYSLMTGITIIASPPCISYQSLQRCRAPSTHRLACKTWRFQQFKLCQKSRLKCDGLNNPAACGNPCKRRVKDAAPLAGVATSGGVVQTIALQAAFLAQLELLKPPSFAG